MMRFHQYYTERVEIYRREKRWKHLPFWKRRHEDREVIAGLDTDTAKFGTPDTMFTAQAMP
jgi:hypothetical protein